MRARLTAVALALGLAALPAIAAADPSSTTFGMTLNPIVGGYHESFDDIIHLPPIPVPFFEASHRFSLFEITAYSWPGLIDVPYSDAIQGNTALRLSILDMSFRVWAPSGRIGIGVGETIYNQTTHYAAADVAGVPGGEQQFSRLVGAHYEIASRLPAWSGTWEANVRYAPVMLGTQNTTYESGYPGNQKPERGNQIDTTLRYLHPAGRHGITIVGLRYFNFTATYDVPGHPLSDRNCALLPSVGYLWRLGQGR